MPESRLPLLQKRRQNFIFAGRFRPVDKKRSGFDSRQRGGTNILKQSRSNLEIKVEASIRIIKFIAPKVMTVNGEASPCECDDAVTCAYCVQASLLGFEEKIKANDNTAKNIISYIKRNGIRKTARDLDVQPSVVQYWLKSCNLPQWIIKKYAGVYE